MNSHRLNGANVFRCDIPQVPRQFQQLSKGLNEAQVIEEIVNDLPAGVGAQYVRVLSIQRTNGIVSLALGSTQQRVPLSVVSVLRSSLARSSAVGWRVSPSGSTMRLYWQMGQVTRSLRYSRRASSFLPQPAHSKAKQVKTDTEVTEGLDGRDAQLRFPRCPDPACAQALPRCHKHESEPSMSRIFSPGSEC
jgi:hypothetical protein